MKRQAVDCNKYLKAIHSLEYTENSPETSHTQKKLNFKMGKRYKETFYERGSEMENKHIRYSETPVMREMQMKTKRKQV